MATPLPANPALDYQPPQRAKITLRELAIRGSLWTIGGYCFSQGLRFGGNILLSRMLFPEAFGTMTIINVFLLGLQMFSDIGIGPSIIQNKRGEDKTFLDTAWSIQAIRGCILWLLASALAWPVARYYHDPALTLYIVVAALAALLSGLNSTIVFTLNRKLALGKITLMEISSQVIGLVVMLSWAKMHKSVWALVVGGVAYSFCVCLISHILEGRWPRFAYDKESAKSIRAMGSAVFLSTSILFLANQSERMILGQYTTRALLGIYSLAYFIARFGTNAITVLAQRVLFPSYARLFREDRSRAVRQYIRTSRLITLSAFAGATVLIAVGPWVVRHIYDQRYWEAGWMLQILAIQSVFEIARCPANWMLLAAGKPRWGVWAWMTRAITLFVGLPLSFAWGGITSAIWVISLSTLPPMLVFALGLGKEFPELRKREWIGGTFITAASIGIYWLLK